MGLIFDGVDLETEYGVVVSGAGSWAKPERDRELVHVPGRNGDLIYDNGCWQNIEIPYSLFFRDGWSTEYEAFCGWLCSHVGYYRLEDTDRHPGVYRMAEFAGPLDPKKWLLSDDGVVTVVFNCKPQQWLLSGEEPIELDTCPFVRGYFDENEVWHSDSEDGLATPLFLLSEVSDASLHVINNGSTAVGVTLAIAKYTSPRDTTPYEIDVRGDTAAPNGGTAGISYISSQAEYRYLRISVYSDSGFANLDVSIDISFFDTPFHRDPITYNLSQYLSGKNINNETDYNAFPIITIGDHSEGSIRINDFLITVNGYSSREGIVIDCDSEDCYSSLTHANVNRVISIENSNEKELRDFPYLVPGNNVLGPYQVGEHSELSLINSSSRTVKVIPNWYKI